MSNIVKLDQEKLMTRTNPFLNIVIERFEEMLGCVTRVGNSYYNAYLYEVIGELTRRVCHESNVRLPAKKDEFYHELVEFAKTLRNKNIRIWFGGVTGEHVDYAQADTMTFKIHFNQAWCTEASLQLEDDTKHTRSRTVNANLIHASMGLIKLPHELAHLFTIPIMSYVCKVKDIPASVENLTTPSKIGQKTVDIPAANTKKPRSKKVGDMGFELEQILTGGYRLYFKESEKFRPTTLLFATPSRVGHAMETSALNDWMRLVVEDPLPPEFSADQSFLDYLRPPAEQISRVTKSTGTASKKRKKVEAATKKAAKARKSAGVRLAPESDSSNGTEEASGEDSEDEEEEEEEEEGYDIPKDYIVEGKSWIKN